jgi:hypothetical protein
VLIVGRHKSVVVRVLCLCNILSPRSCVYLLLIILPRLIFSYRVISGTEVAVGSWFVGKWSLGMRLCSSGVIPVAFCLLWLPETSA